MLSGLLNDLRFGFRSLRQAPGFSLVLILTLALGIGANSAVFSVVYAVLLKPPPYPAGERLVQIREATAGQDIPVSWDNLQHWRAESRSVERMAGFENADLTLTGRGDALLTHAGVVSADFFRLTGWKPMEGRLFPDADDLPGASPVVVITAEFWVRMLGSDPGIVGTTLALDGKAYQVVGVLPPGLRFFTGKVDYYLPLGPRDGLARNRAGHDRMVVLGLLKPGGTPGAARADLNGLMRRTGADGDHLTSVAWLAAGGTDEVRKTLLMLLAAVGLVLIIACANVSSLLLVRGTARTREMAIRTAIGAGRRRLARQLFTENLILAAIGAGVGLVLAGTFLRVLVVVGPQDIPRLWEAGINVPVLLFTVAVTTMTGLLAGAAPVLMAGGVDPMNALKQGGACTSGPSRWQSLRSGLVITEIAVTLVLSFGCLLLVQSLIRAQSSDPGFRSEGVLALEIQLPPSSRFYERLLEKLRVEPGVESVGAVNCPPSTGGCARGWYSIADLAVPARADVPLALLTRVDPDYFRTLRIPLLAGRGFTSADGSGQVIVNEQLARHWWALDPKMAVGHPVKFGGPYMAGGTYVIAGVVGNVRQAGLDEPSVPEMYVPFADSPPAAMVVMIRAAGDPRRLIPAVRRDLGLIDADVPVQSLRPFTEWMQGTLERRRFSTLLLGIFALLAVILSAVGIYGVLNYWVSLRQREIAIRVSLGAQRGEILRWAGWHVVHLLAPGLALGMFGAWGVSRWLRSLVFGVAAGDPALLVTAGVAVVAMAGIAAAVPLWRATRVNAIRNLRDA